MDIIVNYIKIWKIGSCVSPKPVVKHTTLVEVVV